VNRSKRLIQGHLTVAILKDTHLIQATIFLFLSPDILADGLFIRSNGRHKIPAGPKMPAVKFFFRPMC